MRSLGLVDNVASRVGVVGWIVAMRREVIIA